MNKDEFLKELTYYLQKMKDSEKMKFITYYEEMISDYVENGVSEDEAVIKIGSPKKIAEELLESYGSVKINMPSTGSRGLNITLLILGFPLWGCLLLSGILLLISMYTVLWCVPFATGVGSMGFLSTSIVGILGSPFIMSKSLSVGVIQLGSGVASIGISLLLGMATITLSKKIFMLTKKINMKLMGVFKKKVVLS